MFLVGALAGGTGANLKYVLLAPQTRERGEHENSITGVEVTRSRRNLVGARCAVCSLIAKTTTAIAIVLVTVHQFYLLQLYKKQYRN